MTDLEARGSGGPTERLVLGLLVVITLAVSFRAAPAKKKTKAPLPKPKLQAFDASLKVLPANFSGSSIVAAFGAFRVVPKGEFETSEEYEKRLKNLPVGTYAFVVPSRYTEATYDADSAMLSLTPTAIHPGDGYSPTQHAGVELSRENERTRKYLGTNAFGASIPIEEYAYDCLSLITDLHAFPTLSANVERSAAPQTKQNARVLVIVTLDQESAMAEFHEHLGLATGYRHDSPTFDDPEELSVRDYSVRAKVQGFWIFNRSTGVVLGRFDAQGGDSELIIGVEQSN